MPEKLKELFFTPAFVDELGQSIAREHPAFDPARFAGLVFDELWGQRELKARMQHVAHCLAQTLPPEFPQALEILRAVAPAFHGFNAMIFADFVEQYGQDYWDLSMPVLAEFTPLASSEFAVRPFIARDPGRAMAYLEAWAEDGNEHVRRLASEGCRPRLPWGMALEVFKRDPAPILPVLEKLKEDESEYVRKSVANNLNDISKGHPGLVLDLCERWYGHSARTDWIVKHACRTLLKAGDSRALRLFGFGDARHLSVQELRLSSRQLPIGATLEYQFQLLVSTPQRCKVRLDLRVLYCRPSGKMGSKVFSIKEGEFEPGQHAISRRLSLADQSTRKHSPGEHSLAIIVNGVEKAQVTFDVVASTAPIP